MLGATARVFGEETARTLGLHGLRLAAVLPPPTHAAEEKLCHGLLFPNPFGTAAGLDKDGRLAPSLYRQGFGFVEVGTVTPKPQKGNPRPRLFRHPAQRALVNRMGFPSDGMETIARRLERHCMPARRLTRNGGARLRAPLVVNIGPNADRSGKQILEDYEILAQRFADIADVLVINVSSPNTRGLRQWQRRDRLDDVLERVGRCGKPIWVKLSPDLTEEQQQNLAEWASERHAERRLFGLVLTNTTTERSTNAPPPSSTVLDNGGANEAVGAAAGSFEPGGLSGAPLFEKSTSMVRFFRQHCPDTLTLVGVGGVTTAERALAKRHAGADLIQFYTGLHYNPRLLDECLAACS